MDARSLLEELERSEGDVAAALAFIAAAAVEIDADELRATRRRAVLLLATGGDPRRDLDPDEPAVSAVAAELDAPERRSRLAGALAALRPEADGLPRVAARLDSLLLNGDEAWRWLACALLAEELVDLGEE